MADRARHGTAANRSRGAVGESLPSRYRPPLAPPAPAVGPGSEDPSQSFGSLSSQSDDVGEQIAPEGLHQILNEIGRFLVHTVDDAATIEVNTYVSANMDQVKDNLKQLILKAEELTHKNDCLLYAASLHPFALYRDQILSSHPRYIRIMDDLQLVGRRFITQGLHVHVGMADHDAAIRVCDSIRLFLPILLALTCSSPYYEGIDTGLHSYRAKLFEALPLAGMPDQLESWDKYLEMVELLTNTGIITSVRDLWWDVRPHPDFGTIEIRICDLPSTFNEILAIVALIQGLVAEVTESDKHLNPNMQVLKSNKWQAARYGLAGTFVYPLLQKKISMQEAAGEIFAKVSPTMKKLGTYHYLS